MANFEEADKLVGLAEGEYSDDPNDSGNWTGGECNDGDLVGTNYGISAPVYAKYIGRTHTVEDMKNMTQQDAINIYKPLYWDCMFGDEINNQSVANILFDAAVNEGQGAAAQMVRETLNLLQTDIKYNEAKNYWNEDIINGINNADQQSFFDTYKDRRLVRYKKDPNASRYL